MTVCVPLPCLHDISNNLCSPAMAASRRTHKQAFLQHSNAIITDTHHTASVFAKESHNAAE